MSAAGDGRTHWCHTLAVQHLPARVILASASPRRRELLSRLIPHFEVLSADVDESLLPGETPEATAERLALAKFRKVAASDPQALVIAGDTVVALDVNDHPVQLAKPADADDAKRMLRRLSGREHQVITGVCVGTMANSRCFAEITAVKFRHLSDEEIETYVDSGEPMDKAGAYAIQGGAKGFVDGYDGSLSNVIGLPIERLEQTLCDLFPTWEAPAKRC